MEKRKATGYNDCYNQPIHEGDIYWSDPTIVYF